jgi:hypothetical protein
MKSVGLIVLGFFIGALAGAWALKALTAGNEFPKGVMAIKAHHSGQLRENLREGRCDAAALSPHLDTLAAVARDIEPAFLLPDSQDGIFRQYAEDMRGRIAKAYDNLGDCERAREAVSAISDGCKACHRDYKG